MAAVIGRSCTCPKRTPAFRTASGEANCTFMACVWHVCGFLAGFAATPAEAAVVGAFGSGEGAVGVVVDGRVVTAEASSFTSTTFSEAGSLPFMAISGWQIVQL